MNQPLLPLFGGFLGIGDDHYPLPWQPLKYDTGRIPHQRDGAAASRRTEIQ
jgi:hypothetical protein